MREILFRGKRLNGDGWVCGDLSYHVHDGEVVYVFPGDGYDSPDCYEVDPDTIGQYTGLTDKKGVKVFEGDIVRCSCGCPHEVVWIQEHGGAFVGGMPTFYLSGLSDGYAWTGEEEVIGNIHDNSDLLTCHDNG